MSVKKCKFCFSPLPENLTLCPLCRIDNNRDQAQLDQGEVKIWHAARNLHIVSFLAIIGGILGLVGCLLLFAPANQPLSINLLLVNFAFATASVVFGVSLRKYTQWCYIGGIVLYSLFLLMHLMAGRWFGVFFSAVFIYCVANPMAKKILYRQIEDPTKVNWTLQK